MDLLTGYGTDSDDDARYPSRHQLDKRSVCMNSIAKVTPRKESWIFISQIIADDLLELRAGMLRGGNFSQVHTPGTDMPIRLRKSSTEAI